jgi:peptidoglycan/LPS O-acetylase OafA/YrhL
MEQHKKRRYITGFDGLRTIGVLGVILYHLRPDIFRGGYLGVPIFMVVSGYLITDGLIMEFDRTGGFDFKGFWQRRIRRLYPGLVLMLLATSAYITLFARGLLHNLHQIVLSNLTYLYNWWQIANGQSYFAKFAQGDSPFTHLWTLSIEGQFYLIWPLIMLLVLRRSGANYKKRGFQVAMALAVVSALLMAILYQPKAGIPYDPSRLYYGTDTRAFSILLGAGLAFLWPSARLAQNVSRTDKTVLNVAGGLALIGMLAMVIFTTDQSPFLYRGGMFIFSILVTLLVAVVAHPGAAFNRLLSNPVFSWIGRRSYGLYLYQLPVMVFVEGRATNLADHQLLYPLLEVILIVGITELSYRFVEQPLAHAQFTRKNLFTFSQSLKQRNQAIRVGILAVIAVIGLVGVFQAPHVKAAGESPLAKRLADTKKDKVTDKKRLKQLQKRIAEADKSESSSGTSSSSRPVKRQPERKLPAPVKRLTAAETAKAKAISFTAIGDSVMKDGEPLLEKIFPQAYIDAVPSRQVLDGVEAMKKYAAQGALAHTILVGLGTNGPVTADNLADMMAVATTKRQVYWINVRVPTKQWQNTTNAALKNGAKRYPNLHIINWYGYANPHNNWFYDDHVHPNPDGSQYYATFIAKALIDAN